MDFRKHLTQNIYNMNNFFNKMLRREAPIASASESQSSMTGGSFRGRTVNIGSPDAALSVSAWYRASEVLSTTMSMLRMEFQKYDGKHGKNWKLCEEEMLGFDHLNYLLQVQPNPTMTAGKLWMMMTLARMNEGNAVAYIERDSVLQISAIWLCSSAVLNLQNFSYTLTYNTPWGQRTAHNVDSGDVIHWRNTFSNDYGLTGISTLQYAKSDLSTAATNNSQAKDIASKGGKHKIILTEKEQPGGMQVLNLLNKDQKTKQQEDLQQALDNGKDVLLMSGMMSAQVISQDAQAQQLLESRKFDVAAISRFTGVPPVLLMDYTNNTYKAPEQAMTAFFQHTISPMAEDLEREINVKLIGERLYRLYRFHFNEEALLRLDPLGRANLGKVLLETGVKCVNELRHDNNLPEVEGGDTHYLSTNLQPLGNKDTTTNKGEGGAE